MERRKARGVSMCVKRYTRRVDGLGGRRVCAHACVLSVCVLCVRRKDKTIHK